MNKITERLLLCYKKLSDTAKEPTRGSADAAGWDLYSDNTEDIIVRAHMSASVPTNIAVKIPEGYFGGVYARSGLAFKNGIRPVNCTGIIDSDYTGNIMVGLHNDNDDDFIVTPGMRIAQLIIQKHENIKFFEVEDLEKSNRGSNGFGSTGLY